MTVLCFDLNVPPQKLLDLNEYPQDDYGGEEMTEDEGRVVQDFDLNLTPPHKVEEEHLQSEAEKEHQQPAQGAPCPSGHIVHYACKNELRNDKRKQLSDALISRCIRSKGKLTQETVKDLASSFLVSERTVRRIRQIARQCLKQGTVIDVSTKRSQCGRKPIQVDLSVLRYIPLSKRTTLDDLSRHLKVSKDTLSKFKKIGLIRKHTNSIKPHLTDQNMKERLRWCLSMLDPRSIHVHPTFKDLCDIIFIDEKWFYLARKCGTYYLLRDEDDPYRSCQNKNFMRKVMFLFALGRPRLDNEGKCTFDGKIGCFPLVTYEPAKRTSRNRVAGTLEMKPITSVTKDLMRALLIEKVIPAIRAKWPSEDIGKPIYIQQDNARPHIDPSDPLFREAAQKDGFNIQLICQPPNSPDLNVLDLGFFASIQSIQFKNAARTVLDIVNVVQREFHKYSPISSNRVFVTLQTVMIEVMKARGGNKYKTPHINKPALEREGRLPLQMKCDLDLVQEVRVQIEE